MNQEEKEDLTKTIIGALQSQRDIDGKTHKVHHDFIETQIIKTNDRRELTNALKKQVFGWGILAMLAGIGKAVYHFFVKTGGQL